MYRYTPDENDEKRAHHQALSHGDDDPAVKRIGNLGEFAFEQFCREYLPVEMWEWKNEEAVRYCVPESFSGYDFELFGYEVDVKTSRDVSAFLPERLLGTDPDDDIVVMVWHRDNEDSLILLGWERIETLESKAASQAKFSGEAPEKLDHLAARPMNELIDLGPNTAHMNQQPQNPFSPGDRVVKAEGDAANVGVVVEALPPEKDVWVYRHQLDDEAVKVAYPKTLDDAVGDWRDTHPALLASYCHEHEVKCYNYNHTNLEPAANPYVPGDRVVKTSHADPDVAIVVERVGNGANGTVEVVYTGQLGDAAVPPEELASYCEERDIKRYPYGCSELDAVEVG